MLAVDHVRKETLGVLELCSLCPDSSKLPLDHAGSLRLTAVQDLPDLRQAHADVLAGPQYPQALDMFLAVVALTCQSAVGDDDALVVPVPQHVYGHSEAVRNLSDLHEAIFPLDLRST